ncbi:MAG TPA: hypothetical protein VK081_13780 [Planctomycetota bacterium]|nr:hypothetical protein [Planctomycetota bacterium]
MPTSVLDRRVFRRLRVAVPVQWRVPAASGPIAGSGTTMDVSEGGLLLSVHRAPHAAVGALVAGDVEVALRFVALPGAERQRLQAFVAAHGE